MTCSTSLNCVEKNYTYQHIQGMMLLSLNKLTSKIKLSHSEYRVMCTLIGLYNKNHNKAFPTIEYLAKSCTMGKSTVLKCLNKLVENNLLVVVKTPGKRNNYYFSNLILNNARTPHAEPQRSPTCRTTHDHELINNKTNKNKSSFNQNDDVQNQLIKRLTEKNSGETANINDYKAILNKLNEWSFTGAKFALKKYGIEKMHQLIKLVENHNPENKGAYLRTLINTSGVIHHLEIKTSLSTSEHELIKQMLKHQYWKHILSGKVLKVRPDIGKHLLIRYHGKENMIEFIENGFCDYLDKFEVIK